MNINQAHEYCSHHRALIKKSEFVGCFYCERIYSPRKIYEWINHKQTALCFYCGIDSVLPRFWGLIEPEFLKEMNRHWFSISSYTNLENGKAVETFDIPNEDTKAVINELEVGECKCFRTIDELMDELNND